MIFPRMSFLCKVVPVQYREYEMVYLMKPRSQIANDVGRHKCQEFFFLQRLLRDHLFIPSSNVLRDRPIFRSLFRRHYFFLLRFISFFLFSLILPHCYCFWQMMVQFVCGGILRERRTVTKVWKWLQPGKLCLECFRPLEVCPTL